MAFSVNVPNVPGVPAVIFAAGAGALISFLTRDVVSLFRGAALIQPWGIYLGGAPVVLADNVVNFDYRQQWSISDFPIERGAFQSYDKVQLPYDARFRFTAGGSEANRSSFLASIAAIAGDLNLYTIVTPDAVYANANISHYDYSRAARNGAGLITVEVWTLEIRESATVGMSNTISPTASGQTNTGTVQPTAPTATQAATAPVISGPGFVRGVN